MRFLKWLEETTDTPNLTHEQQSVISAIVHGIKSGNRQIRLGGLAGTGKSVLVKYLKHYFPKFAVCAFTGKAANVLRSRGVDASTIHSQIYTVNNKSKKPFKLVENPKCNGFIIDEASMVSQDIYKDLASFRLPMIFVGDHGQLEPVGSDFNLMQNPDFRLETIHRNAGDIARFAEHLRNGGNASDFTCSDGTVELINAVNNAHLQEVDQVICAYNTTKAGLNNYIRSLLYPGQTKLIVPGERIMCLKNNKELSLFNGMQGTAINVKTVENKKYLDFEFDDIIYEDIPLDTSQFGKEEYNLSRFGKSNPFDYAYAITCHKAQGDEWPKVLVVEQKCSGWDHKRWAYTAASRAESKLYWKVV